MRPARPVVIHYHHHPLHSTAIDKPEPPPLSTRHHETASPTRPPQPRDRVSPQTAATNPSSPRHSARHRSNTTTVSHNPAAPPPCHRQVATVFNTVLAVAAPSPRRRGVAATATVAPVAAALSLHHRRQAMLSRQPATTAPRHRCHSVSINTICAYSRPPPPPQCRHRQANVTWYCTTDSLNPLTVTQTGGRKEGRVRWWEQQRRGKGKRAEGRGAVR